MAGELVCPILNAVLVLLDTMLVATITTLYDFIIQLFT